MDVVNIIEDVNIALALIKKGEIVLTSNGKEKTHFALKGEKILCLSPNASFKLSFDEFIKTFEGSKFILYTFEEGSEVDLKKDEEYYSWDVLSK